MIYDKFENRERYTNTHPLFARAFVYIEEYLKTPVEPGVYEIDGRHLFAKVQEYQTREKGYLEVHDHYIDVQYMVEGKEKVLYSARAGLEPVMEYDEKEDALFLKDAESPMEFMLKAGEFAIFFPEDAHQPAMKSGKTEHVKKIVLKVVLDKEGGVHV